MKLSKPVTAGLLLSVLLIAGTVVAKSGGLSVQVTDSAGRPLPGATVTISHDRGFVKTTTIMTNAQGVAVFPVLRPGKGYLLEIAFPGFGSRRVRDIQVKSNGSQTIEVRLVAELTEKITVSAEGDVVDLVTTSSSTSYSDEVVQDLPVPGRFYQNVLSLAPGVRDADGDGNPNVHGSRDRDFKAYVSGVANVAPLTSSGESYDHIEESGFRVVPQQPLSTFSIDVDTASYSNVRRILSESRLPPRGAVRIEELVNYFDYDYPAPRGDAPFGVDVEVAEAPWSPGHRLARIGIKGRTVPDGERPTSNLVFLIDVSGSMQPPNKLPLLKQAMRMLTENLAADDLVTIVVYAGASGVVLEPTFAGDRSAILLALDRLGAGGSTAGGAGIQLAYAKARETFVSGGINRVILATDGDFNVGVTSRSELVDLVRREAASGVFLTVLGFGGGNLKDATLEQLADKGNGNYAYIDSAREARKVLVEEIGGTLVTIAKDVKIQVEFNPAEVAAYRLIGYENRALAAEDFNDDRKDAGEIGAGHTVTALYEIIPRGVEVSAPGIDPLKYQRPAAPTETADSGELFTLKIRYKQPDGETSRLLSFPVSDGDLALAAASEDFKFAASVAGFGMLLRGSDFVGDLDIDGIVELALAGAAHDVSGHRSGFLDLVEQARGPLARQTEAAMR